jgi:hypothetical protein
MMDTGPDTADEPVQEPGEPFGEPAEVFHEPAAVFGEAFGEPAEAFGEPAEASREPGEPRPAPGEPRVDAALARLDELDGRPVTEHRPIFEDVHRRLRDVLGELDTRDPSQAQEATDAVTRADR